MKNIILFLYMGSNKEILRKVSQQMEVDNCLVYKSKQTGNWYKWEKSSTGRPEALTKDEVQSLLHDSNNKIINWGNHILHDQPNIILNKPSAQKRSSNKWETRRIWQENGIKTPLSSTTLSDMVTFPFIARPYMHARQSEFNVINNLTELAAFQYSKEHSSEEWYYQKIVQKTCEFRVYVASNKVLTIFWKGDGDQLLSSNQEWHWFDDVNWNPEKLPPCVTGDICGPNCYPLDNLKEDIAKIKEECIKATKVLGLDYSGIDVGLDTNTGEFNLFESNTDPELTALPIKKFAKYFDEVLQNA
jgi:hypothetical protein